MNKSKLQPILKVILIITICLQPIYSFSQKYIDGEYTQELLDSLNQEAMNCNTEGMNALIKLSTYYYNLNDMAKHRHYIDRELKCVEAHGSKYNILNAYWKLMQYHARYPGMDSILIINDKVNALIEGDTSFNARRARIMPLILLGNQYYKKMDDAETAYKYFKKSIDFSLNDKFYDIYISNIESLASYYNDDGEYKKAIDLINEGLSNIPDHKNPDNKSLYQYTNVDFMNIGIIDCNFQKARATLENQDSDKIEKMESYKEVQKYIAVQDNGFVDVLIGIELILSTLDDVLPLDTLLTYGNKALKLDESFDEDFPTIYQYHGKNLLKAGQFKKAKKYLEQAAVIMKKKEASMYENIAYVHDALATTYLKLGDKEKVQENIDLYKIYTDSFYIRKSQTAVETIETKYALSQKEAENLKITQEAQSLSERLKLFGTIGALLFLFLGLAITFYLQQRRNAQKLLRLNEMKDKIFTILGHDLKGPSLAFNSLTKKLSYLIKKNDVNRLLELAPRFEERGERLSRIINDVLNWALTENESFLNNPEKISVLPIIKQAVEDLNWDLNEKNISVEINISEEEEVLFDKNAFMIINRNLLHNAIKFSPENESINIRYNSQAKNLEYIDAGKGMSTEIIKKILNEVPVQSDVGTKNERGTGIGLVTCLKLIKQNNGDLSFLKNTPTGTIVQLGFA